MIVSGNRMATSLISVPLPNNQDSDTLSIYNTSFSSVSKSTSGGSILIATVLNTFIFYNVTFHNCSSPIDGGALHFKVYSPGSLDLRYVTFTECKSQRGGGVYISAESSGTIVISHCTFTNCSVNHNDGGGLYMNIYWCQSAGAVIDSCTFENCTSPNYGGGMGMHTRSSVVNVIEIKNTLYSNCSCSGGGWWGGGGIGIEVFNGGTTLIGKCTFEKCHVAQFGGALYVVAHQNSVTTVVVRIIWKVRIKSMLTRHSFR